MPSKRFHNLPAEKQARILQLAAEEFASAGFEGASYNRIIQRCGVSKGAMYYYFDDKADLYATVVGHAVGAMMAGVGGFADAETDEEFWALLEAEVNTAMVLYRHDATLVGLFRQLVRNAMTGVEAQVLASLRVEFGSWTDVFIGHGHRVGAIRTDLPDSLLSSLLMGLGEGHDVWLTERIDQLSEAELAAVAPRLVDLYKRLLAP